MASLAIVARIASPPRTKSRLALASGDRHVRVHGRRFGADARAQARGIRSRAHHAATPRPGLVFVCKVILPHYNLPSENEVSMPVRVRS